MKFRVLTSSHDEPHPQGVRRFRAGDVVDVNKDLAKLFPNKFEAVSEEQETSPGEVKLLSGKKADIHKEAQENVSQSTSEGEKEELKDITNQFKNTDGIIVGKDASGYRVFDTDNNEYDESPFSSKKKTQDFIDSLDEE